MFELFAQIGPYEVIAIMVIGFLAGFLFLPYLVKYPILGAWIAGVVFTMMRYITNPSDRSIISMILWTLMIATTYVGRYIVKRTFNLPELATVYIVDVKVPDSPEVKAALIAFEEVLRETKEQRR